MLSHPTLITPAQCRAARAALGWSQDQLAERAGVSRAMLTGLESGKRTSLLSTMRSIVAVLSEAGIVLEQRENLRGVFFVEESDRG